MLKLRWSSSGSLSPSPHSYSQLRERIIVNLLSHIFTLSARKGWMRRFSFSVCGRKRFWSHLFCLFVCFGLNHGAKIPYIEPFRINKGCRLFSQRAASSSGYCGRRSSSVLLNTTLSVCVCCSFVFLFFFFFSFFNTIGLTSVVTLKPSKRFHLTLLSFYTFGKFSSTMLFSSFSKTSSSRIEQKKKSFSSHALLSCTLMTGYCVLLSQWTIVFFVFLFAGPRLGFTIMRKKQMFVSLRQFDGKWKAALSTRGFWRWS